MEHSLINTVYTSDALSAITSIVATKSATRQDRDHIGMLAKYDHAHLTGRRTCTPRLRNASQAAVVLIKIY